jgi:hypothetical protein
MEFMKNRNHCTKEDMMRLTSLLIVGFSLAALANVVSTGNRFDSDVRRVDVIEQINHQTAQMDSSKHAGPVKRVDVIEKINDQVAQVASNKNAGQGTRIGVIEGRRSHGPAYPYTKPMSR